MAEFLALTLKDWRQFADIQLDLSKQVTVLTGQNGCGKTSLLNILNRHFGWTINFVSTPYMGKRTAKKLWSDIYRRNKLSNYDEFEDWRDELKTIGKIRYSNDTECTLRTNTLVKSQYELNFANTQPVVGMHIPSHRPMASYNKVPSIPTDPKTANVEYQEFQQLLMQYSNGVARANPGSLQKQSLISFAVFGEGNSSVTPNFEIQSLFKTFQEVLRNVLPASLGFERIEIRMPEVVLVTRSGDFSLDAMSGGVNAIFSIAWQIHMYSHDKQSFTITFDEPENHLHPSMQRTILPNLASAFPTAKLIVATHSPFIVSSFPDANIYALVRDEEERVISQQLNMNEISGTPNEVLREILDVGSNLPIWVEDKIGKIIAETAAMPPAEKARSIMEQLGKLGIADAIVEYKRSDLDAKDR